MRLVIDLLAAEWNVCCEILWERLIPLCLSLNGSMTFSLNCRKKACCWTLREREGTAVTHITQHTGPICVNEMSSSRNRFRCIKNLTQLEAEWRYKSAEILSQMSPLCVVLGYSKLSTNASLHFLLFAHICLLQLPTQVLRLVCFGFVLSFALSV